VTGATILVDGGFMLRHPGMSDGADFDDEQGRGEANGRE
jgi:hypothetical protein